MSETRVRYRDAVAEALRMETTTATAVVPERATKPGTVRPARPGVPQAVRGALRLRSPWAGIRYTAAGAAAAGCGPSAMSPSRMLGELTRVAELCRAERVELPLLLRIPLGGLSSGGAADELRPRDVAARPGGGEGRGAVHPGGREGHDRVGAAAPRPGLHARARSPVRRSRGRARGQPSNAARRSPSRAGRRAADADRVRAGLAAERAASELGDVVEVIDLRTLQPLDDAAILASVRRTGKVLIVAEANRLVPRRR